MDFMQYRIVQFISLTKVMANVINFVSKFLPDLDSPWINPITDGSIFKGRFSDDVE